jgi:hypothetical protein
MRENATFAHVKATTFVCELTYIRQLAERKCYKDSICTLEYLGKRDNGGLDFFIFPQVEILGGVYILLT